MAKYILRLLSILVILFISVPFIVSLWAEHTYSLPLDSLSTVSLSMPDGSCLPVSEEEYFSGAAAAYLPDVNNEEILRAFCLILKTSELTSDGVLYLSPDERSQLLGEQSSERERFYADIVQSVDGQSLLLSDDVSFSLNDFMAASENCSGSYIEILSALFPGSSLIKET